jgi:multiple sugar transport system substrate-binding protein
VNDASRDDRTVRVALVGGPMYDPLYAVLPEFEREAALRVEIVAQLPHPELNAFVRSALSSGGGNLDLISTHTKYAPSQAGWLTPLDGEIPSELVADLLPHPAELSRIDGRLLQVPRNLDVRLLHCRTDLFDDPVTAAAYTRAFGAPFGVPGSWTELAQVASFLKRPGMYGFLFPGRDSGLFGTFYELLIGAGGELFDDALQPAFASDAGEWAAAMIAELHHARRVTPRNLSAWHYDEISASFRAGHAALVSDWPGSYHLYTNPATCTVSGNVSLALLPRGPAGARAAYAGCHSFAVPRTSRNRRGALALLQYLTSFDSQLGEARRGAIPCRGSALQRVRHDASDDPAAERRWELLAETEQFMIVPPRFAAYPKCEDAIWRSIQRAMEGEWSPAEAVTRATADIQAIVESHISAG